MMEYSEAFRRRMVKRMSGPHAMTATALSEEVGVTQPTLSRWLREAATVETVSKKKRSKPKASRTVTASQRRSKKWTATEKYRVVMESAALSDSDLGEFLRREGLHEEALAQLREEVRSAAIAGLDASSTTRAAEAEEQRRTKALERELRRKEAALAEAAALLVLRKKAVALWGEEGDDT